MEETKNPGEGQGQDAPMQAQDGNNTSQNVTRTLASTQLTHRGFTIEMRIVQLDKDHLRLDQEWLGDEPDLFELYHTEAELAELHEFWSFKIHRLTMEVARKLGRNIFASWPVRIL